ncbi:uncharacterized protein LOC143885408 isoform X2 [Tasmannia lanceolata]|uniref:uncharacterized protein LOC143885408 isoform X2 n=1 Tax=Tasmannia lanceolata TaxID=3420 RepID=UPI004064018A
MATKPSTDSNQTPVSSFQKAVVCLSDWWLTKSESVCHRKRLGVAGFISSCGQQAVRVFHSAPIAKRHDSYTLETTDGITIMLWGLINKSHTHQNGFPPEACKKFLTGFPYNWEAYADQYLGKESTRSAPAFISCFDKLFTFLDTNASSVPSIPLDELLTNRMIEQLSQDRVAKNDVASCAQGKEHGECATNATDAVLKESRNMSVSRELDNNLKGWNEPESEVPRKNTSMEKLENFNNDIPRENASVCLGGSVEESMSTEPDDKHLDISERLDNCNQNTLEDANVNTSLDKERIAPCATEVTKPNESPITCSYKRRSSRLKNLKSILKESTISDQNTNNENKLMSVAHGFVSDVVDLETLGMEKQAYGPRKSTSKEKLENPNNKILRENASVGLRGAVEKSMSTEPDDRHLNISDRSDNCNHNNMEDVTVTTSVATERIVPCGAKMEKPNESPIACSSTRRSSGSKNLKNIRKESTVSDQNTNNETKLMSVAHDFLSDGVDLVGEKMTPRSTPNKSNGGPEMRKEKLFSAERDVGYLGDDNVLGINALTVKSSSLSKSFCHVGTSKHTIKTGSDGKDAIPSKGETSIFGKCSSKFEARRSSDRLKKLKKNLKEDQTTNSNLKIGKNKANRLDISMNLKRSNDKESGMSGNVNLRKRKHTSSAKDPSLGKGSSESQRKKYKSEVQKLF